MIDFTIVLFALLLIFSLGLGSICLIINVLDKDLDGWQRIVMGITLYVVSAIILAFVFVNKANAQVPFSQFPYVFNVDKNLVQLSQHAYKDGTYKDALVENILYTCDNLVIKTPKYIKKNAPHYFGVPSKYLVASVLHQLTEEQLVGVQIVFDENDYEPCEDLKDGLELALGYFSAGYIEYRANAMFNDIILVYTLTASAMFTHETIKHNIAQKNKYGPEDARYTPILEGIMALKSYYPEEERLWQYDDIDKLPMEDQIKFYESLPRHLRPCGPGIVSGDCPEMNPNSPHGVPKHGGKVTASTWETIKTWLESIARPADEQGLTWDQCKFRTTTTTTTTTQCDTGE